MNVLFTGPDPKFSEALNRACDELFKDFHYANPFQAWFKIDKQTFIIIIRKLQWSWTLKSPKMNVWKIFCLSVPLIRLLATIWKMVTKLRSLNDQKVRGWNFFLKSQIQKIHFSQIFFLINSEMLLFTNNCHPLIKCCDNSRCRKTHKEREWPLWQIQGEINHSHLYVCAWWIQVHCPCA